MEDPRLSPDMIDEVMALPSMISIRRACDLLESDLRTDVSALIADVLEMYGIELEPASRSRRGPRLHSV